MELYKIAINQFRIAFLLLIFLTILTGIIYPLIITGIAQILFPWQANGSLVEQDGKIVGSMLIGQFFDDPKYFWSRPSATSPFPYNAESSSGSNMGPSNPIFLASVKNRVAYLRATNLQTQKLIPVDLVTSSGSGLDPEISPLAALYQINRIANIRHIALNDLQLLIKQLTKKRTFGILGEPRINVLQLNLALDALSSQTRGNHATSQS